MQRGRVRRERKKKKDFFSLISNIYGNRTIGFRRSKRQSRSTHRINVMPKHTTKPTDISFGSKPNLNTVWDYPKFFSKILSGLSESSLENSVNIVWKQSQKFLKILTLSSKILGLTLTASHSLKENPKPLHGL